MSATTSLPRAPRVAAILVVHDGAQWLGSVLATVGAQRYDPLELVVVDSGSRDGSSEILARRIPADRLITLPRNVGFARAVAAAMNHPAVAAADLLLFLHDDLVLEPHAIAELVGALRDDSSLSIVGPKLREWSDDGVLSEIGMTIDRFGRAEPRVERGELDQGQHDGYAEVLYVNTAGMLLRRELFRSLGGFDARFPAYRDDLDLCWRAWLTGHRVEVVPSAVGYHIGAGARAGRAVRSASHGGRYLAERHSVAAMIKNYSTVTLAWVLPLTLVLAVAKSLAFLAVRRFGAAGAVVRAYLWNIAQLPRTLRRRRAVQRRRSVSDRQLGRLFAPGLPRARVYGEAVGAWLAGGSSRALIDDETTGDLAEQRPQGGAIGRFVRERPAAAVGAVLLVVYLIGLGALLGPGQVVGGEIAPWPAQARDFLRSYAAPHSGDPLATVGFASPIQAVLGILSFLGFGSAWLAQRLLVFGLVPLAWILALRAGRLITSHPAPRALGATLYALSPVVLGALGNGRYGVLVVAALLPGLVLVGVRAADIDVAAATSWRATALLALGLAVAVAAAPSLAPLLLVGVAAGVVISLRRQSPDRTAATLRLVIATVAALVMLSPWLISVAVDGRQLLPAIAQRDALPLWRAVTGVPAVLPGLTGVAGALSALASVAVVGASILLGLRRSPDVVAVLVAIGAVMAFTAWGADRLGLVWLWAPSLLLPTALAIGGLAVLAARGAGTALAQYAFGARQLSVVIATALLGVGLLVAVARLAVGPYASLQVSPELVPAFVTADGPTVGPYRVLLLADRGGELRWDVVAHTGPTMVRFRAPTSPELSQALDGAVAAIAGGADPRAGAALGVLNVRYVVIAGDGTSPVLAQALADQPALEPMPTGAGRVYRLRSWLPRASVLPRGVANALAATADPGNTRRLHTEGLQPRSPSVYAGTAARDGVLLLAEADRGWNARADGRPLPGDSVELPLGDGLMLPSWPATEGSFLEVEAAGTTGHVVVLVLQALAVLVVISLALRPPRFAQRPQTRRRRGTALPRQLRLDPSDATSPADDPGAAPPMETKA